MTEAQKYQGALYKEKPSKQQKQQKQQRNKPTGNANAKPNKPHHPYVEDAPDADDPKSKQPPPPAPSPPPPSAGPPSTKVAAPGNDKVNVFDFLVTDQTPNASRVSLAGSKEQMTMVPHARSVFEPGKALAKLDTDVEDEDKEYDIAYEENGFSYGAEPIKPSLYGDQIPNISMDFMTPAPKKSKDKSRRKKDDGSTATTSEKKRKRGHVEELDVEAANSRYEEDTPMVDAPSSVLNNAGTPTLNHSGLTGGLNRMLRDERSMSPEYEDYTDDEEDQRRYQDPQSPLKRTRRGEKGTSNGDGGLGISIKGRAGRIMSSMFGGSALSGSSGSTTEPASKALVRTRRGSSDGEGHTVVHVRRIKKAAPRVRQLVGNGTSEYRKSKRKISNGEGHYDQARPSRRLKAIEYDPDRSRSRSRSPGDDDNRKLVVYRHHEKLTDAELQREKASHFLSLVNKGPESDRGCSVHKALKRFHRDYPSLAGSEDHDDERERRGRGRSRADRERKHEEEKDLWRTLRLKRNDRGEVVVFF
jgi:cell growth-regulating nucleolar protein